MEAFLESGVTNVALCKEAISLLYSIDATLVHDVLNDEKLEIPGHSSLLNCEETLLDLASSRETDGIFYLIACKININDSEVNVLRYFENGCFVGAMCEATDLVSKHVGLSEYMKIRVYNNIDVGNAITRKNLLEVKRGYFYFILFILRMSIGFLACF